MRKSLSGRSAIYLVKSMADGIALTPKAVAAQDCVAVAVDHAGVDYSMVLKQAKAVFDIRNVYRGKVSPKITKL